jgi:hypothetical protein
MSYMTLVVSAEFGVQRVTAGVCRLDSIYVEVYSNLAHRIYFQSETFILSNNPTIDMSELWFWAAMAVPDHVPLNFYRPFTASLQI